MAAEGAGEAEAVAGIGKESVNDVFRIFEIQ